MMEFDEDEAIAYIRKHVDPALGALYDDDELLNLIDLVYDYYEANGMLDIDLDCDDDDDPDMDDLRDYILRMLRKDKGAKLLSEHVEPLLSAYLEYEASLSI
ncbi:MAG: hypothetical protein K2L77_01575 [Muribaculaceae bacterium]|nr:hypothetical protein [Muribaculaceae bacterium]